MDSETAVSVYVGGISGNKLKKMLPKREGKSAQVGKDMFTCNCKQWNSGVECVHGGLVLGI